ncbi:MAG: DUF3987 domain-containing protein [Bacteroidales bacterium]
MKDRLMRNKGLCILYDEVRGFFESLNQYRHGGDKQNLLSMWSGFGFKDTRKARENDTSAPDTRLCIIGNTQKTLLHKTFGGEIEPDGLLDRISFQRINSHRKPNQFRYTTAMTDDVKKQRYQEIIHRLLMLRWESPEVKTIDRSKEASRVFEAYIDYLIGQQEISSHEFYPGLYSKAEILLGRFALILQVIDSMYENCEPESISEDVARKAVILTQHFINEGKEAYDTIVRLNNEDPERNAKIIAHFLVNVMNTSKAEAARLVGKSKQWASKYITKKVTDGGRCT